MKIFSRRTSISINKTMFFLIAILILLNAVLGYKSTTKLTYLEYEVQNDKYDGYIALLNPGEKLTQDFYLPYNVIHGVSLKIGTFSIDTNSIWNIAVIDKESRALLYQDSYNASFIKDNSFNIFEFKRNIKVDRNRMYQIRITAENANEGTSLAFYQLSNKTTDQLELSETGGEICYAMYGGDTDYWWLTYTILITSLVMIFIIRLSIVQKREKNYQMIKS